MSTWMINGPGQAFYVGNRGPASQFNPSGQVSPGSNYVPDEVAKQLVKEAGLRKSDTVPKRVIVGYLESMGLSAGLAPDVAMVLRNVYGVTPTFDESTERGSNAPLLAELRGALNESYPAPFRIDEPEILSELDELGSCIVGQYMESKDPEYDVVLEHLAALDPSDLLDIVEFHEWAGPDVFSYLSDLVVDGPDGLAEEVVEGLCFPDRLPQMSEDVQYHVERAALDKQARKQLKLHAKDLGHSSAVDPLERKAKLAKTMGVSGMKTMTSKQRSAGMEKAKAKQKDMKRAAMKEKGKKALGFMKKVGGAIKKGVGAAAKGAAKAATAPVGGALKGAGYVAGRVAGGAVKGYKASGASDKADSPSAPASAQASSARSSDSGSSSSSGSEPKKKEGLGARIAKGIGRFAKSVVKNVAAGYRGDTPGIQSQTSKKGDDKKKAPGATKPSMAGESVLDVMEAIAPSDLSGRAVCEAMSGLSWDGVAHIANIALLPVEESFALLSAFKTDADEFVAEWMELVDGGHLPEGVSPESFSTLQMISLDEGVVPALVGAAVRALQSASEGVASYIESAYPELGRTVYGPAGDPRRGPEMAKSYMTPYPAGADRPAKGYELMTTRMFSDPDAREKERAERLSDVMQVLGNMRDSAAASGVNPEGMFLNVYRDMHREKVRYS